MAFRSVLVLRDKRPYTFLAIGSFELASPPLLKEGLIRMRDELVDFHRRAVAPLRFWTGGLP